MVAALLIVVNALGKFGCAAAEGVDGIVQCAHSVSGHFAGDAAALAQGKRGCGEKTHVKLGRLLVLRVCIVRNNALGERFEQPACGQEQRSAKDIECRVCHGDARHGSRFIKKCRSKRGAHDAEHRQQHDNANDVEEKMDNGGAAGVLVCADGGEHGGDGRADVLPHDDGNGRSVAHRAGDGERLQNTDGRRARLDHSREQRAGEHAENGILKGDKKVRESGNVLQSRNGSTHRFHAEHERRKAEQDHTGVLFLVILAEHVVDDTDERKHGRKGGGL